MKGKTMIFIAACAVAISFFSLARGEPVEVTLSAEIQAPIIVDGKEIGSVKLPMGSEVTFVSFVSDGVMVSRGGGTPFKVAKDVIAPESLALVQATPRPVATPVVAPTQVSSVHPPATAASTPVTNPQSTEWDAGPISGVALDIARFRWWAPANAKSLRGVMVLIPGRNGDGRGFVGDKNWQQLATEMQLALVGCNFYGEKDHFTYQFDPTGDLANAINNAVDKLAANNGFPDLKSPPLIFWGHSAGANVGTSYLKRHPERVLAAICLKGTVGPGDTTPAKNAVPYLIIIGSKDKPEWVKGAIEYYEIAKKQNAIWTFAFSPSEGHEAGKSQPLMLAFLRSVIEQRLGSVSERQIAFASPESPKNLNFSDGWLGNRVTYDIAANASYTGNRDDATWLPDETTAKAWKAFLQGK